MNKSLAFKLKFTFVSSIAEGILRYIYRVIFVAVCFVRHASHQSNEILPSVHALQAYTALHAYPKVNILILRIVFLKQLFYCSSFKDSQP